MLVRNLMSKVKVTLIAMMLSAVCMVGYGQDKYLDPNECNYGSLVPVLCLHNYIHNPSLYTETLCESCDLHKHFYAYAEANGAKGCMSRYNYSGLFVVLNYYVQELGNHSTPHQYLHKVCGWDDGY